VSTEDQMSIEDRVRTATRAGASLIRDVRPLGAPAPVRLRRWPGPAPRRWVNWGVPLAAAAAVAAIALTLVAVRQTGTQSPAASESGTAAPATVPRYYAASTYDAHTGRNGPLIVGDDLTGKVIDTVSTPPGQTFTSVHGMPDDRTFVVQAVVNAKPGESTTYAWYLLRIAPGSAHPHQLTKLPIKLPGKGPFASAYALSPDGRELAVESMPGTVGDTGPDVITLGIYSVASGAELRAWTAPTKMTSGLGGSTLTWLSGGRQLVFNAGEFTAGSAYYSQLRTLDVTATGTDLMADSRPLLTVNNSGASTCLSLQITPDGKAAICATQYAFVTGDGSNAGCANGGLKFIAFPLPAAKPSRVLYQYRGACHSGESFTLWTDPSASSIIGVTRIDVDNKGTKEAIQIGVITGGRFRPLNIAKSIPSDNYGDRLAF
jgi:hypothetical protein